MQNGDVKPPASKPPPRRVRQEAVRRQPSADTRPVRLEPPPRNERQHDQRDNHSLDMQRPRCSRAGPTSRPGHRRLRRWARRRRFGAACRRWFRCRTCRTCWTCRTCRTAWRPMVWRSGWLVHRTRCGVWSVLARGVRIVGRAGGSCRCPRSIVCSVSRSRWGVPSPPGSAWALLTMLAGEEPAGLSAPRRSQLRRHLLDADAAELAARLGRRAYRRFVDVHPSRLRALAADSRVVLTGLVAAGRAGARLVVTEDADEVEGYLAEGDLAALDADHGLVDAVDVANVVLRVVDDEVTIPCSTGVAAAVVVGLDLGESGDARACEQGQRLFAAAVQATRSCCPGNTGRFGRCWARRSWPLCRDRSITDLQRGCV